MGVDVSEAVRLAAPSIPSAGGARAKTRGEMRHRGPSREAGPCLLLGRAARAARATGAGARPLCRGPAGFGGAWVAGHGARQAARRAQDGGALRCQFGPAPTSRLDLCGRLNEAREY